MLGIFFFLFLFFKVGVLVRDKEVRVVGERANVRNPTDLSDKCVFRMLPSHLRWC